MDSHQELQSLHQGVQQYRCLCGIPALFHSVTTALSPLDWLPDSRASLTLVIDGPWGFALRALPQEVTQRVVIVTDSPCAEYLEDLRDCLPYVLLAGGHGIAEIAHALKRAALGESFRHMPYHSPVLTAVERRLLQCCALGYGTREVASKLELQEGTVKNGMTRIFQKLGLENRTQLALYYWGLWGPIEASLLKEEARF